MDQPFMFNAFLINLTLVAVAKNQIDVAMFFNLVTNLVNVVGASCKCKDMLFFYINNMFY
jgi:hypothetical protein